MRASRVVVSMRSWKSTDVTNSARPESVVMLAATVPAAREMLRRERIDGRKERVF